MTYTVLIVDDVMLNIDALSSILKDNYTIMAAVSGESAIKLLTKRIPDIVLLDISMPGIDGFGVLQFIKGVQELSNIPVIFVTGERDEFTEEKGLSLGAVDYIKKPYNAAVVKTKVRNHLQLKAYKDNLEALVFERTKELEARTKELEEQTIRLGIRTKQLAASHEAIIMGMSLMSDSRDSVTGRHIERIKFFTELLAAKMLELYPGLITQELAEQIVLFSPLHDVGKVYVPDKILNKEGALTFEEFEIMKAHTVNAAKLLKKTELFFKDVDNVNFNVAIDIAKSHHEKYDGSGYPNGLAGDEIPLPARIVAIADIYDALRSERPYKRAYTHNEAIDIILNGDNRTKPEHFDPKVIEAFVGVSNDFWKFYA